VPETPVQLFDVPYAKAAALARDLALPEEAGSRETGDGSKDGSTL